MKNGNDKAREAVEIVREIEREEERLVQVLEKGGDIDEINRVISKFVAIRENLIAKIAEIKTDGASPQTQAHKDACRDIRRMIIPCHDNLTIKTL